MARGLNWTKPEVIEELHSLNEQGYKMSFSNISKVGAPGLADATVYFFGSWRDALIYIGLPYTEENIIRAIQKLYNTNQSLSVRDVSVTHSVLYYNSIRLFKNWGNALEKAGVPIKRRVKWSEEEVIKRIRALNQSNQSLRYMDLENTHKSLTNNAIRLFGSWGKAVEAAGIVYEKQDVWTKEEIVIKLQEEYKTSYIPRVVEMRKKYPGLVGGAYRLFGSWNNALYAAGIPHEDQIREIWTEENVIKTLRKLYQTNPNIRLRDIQKTHSGLVSRVYRLFGEWDTALQRAGIPREKKEVWTKERVVKTIQKMYQSKISLRSTDIRESHKSLYRNAVKFYKNWGNALKEAGVPKEYTKTGRRKTDTNTR